MIILGALKMSLNASLDLLAYASLPAPHFPYFQELTGYNGNHVCLANVPANAIIAKPSLAQGHRDAVPMSFVVHIGSRETWSEADHNEGRVLRATAPPMKLLRGSSLNVTWNIRHADTVVEPASHSLWRFGAAPAGRCPGSPCVPDTTVLELTCLKGTSVPLTTYTGDMAFLAQADTICELAVKTSLPAHGPKQLLPFHATLHITITPPTSTEPAPFIGMGGCGGSALRANELHLVWWFQKERLLPCSPRRRNARTPFDP